MKITDREKLCLLKINVGSSYKRLPRMIGAGTLTVMLTISVLSGGRLLIPIKDNNGSVAQAATTLTFIADADAQVDQATPNTNRGSSTYLQVDGVGDPAVESFIRFTVTGVSGTIQTARLRVYDTTNASANGPAVYETGTSWTESGITWNNRPARTSDALDNKSSINTSTWVEYDVGSAVNGNGTFSFVLAADSNDAATFSSRQGNQPPQLVITLAASLTATPSPTVTDTFSPTHTASPEADTATPTHVVTSTSTPSATPSLTTVPGTSLSFVAEADAYVKQSYPSTNYGTATALGVNGASNPDVESFIRFMVTGISSTVQSARLRIYATTNSTSNGPPIYATGTSWSETGITWNNRLAATSGAMDNKGAIATNSWVEYDVTTSVAGNGIYSFVLKADSSDGVTFSSREGSRPPQLVVTLGSAETTPSATETSTLEVTSTSVPTLTETPTLEADAATPTPPPTFTSSPTASPTPTSSGDFVLIGAGDISLCSNNNDEATAKLLDNIPGTVFAVGDNAYSDGSYTQYTNCYDPTWGRHKARTKPVPGNHEYQTSGAAGYFQYFNNIPAYYAFNLGSWRIYALNSEVSVSATSAEVTWLQNDLATNPSQCVLAYWHKPRWSSGSTHGSSSSMQTLWQVLYNAGAEVVINGHEHNYERFAEMNASGSAVSQGLREFVVGTGGANLYPFGTVLSTSQVRNNTTYGVLKLTLRNGEYDWQFVPVAGSTFTDSGSDTCH